LGRDVLDAAADVPALPEGVGEPPRRLKPALRRFDAAGTGDARALPFRTTTWTWSWPPMPARPSGPSWWAPWSGSPWSGF
jgi:hypothetical protein